MSRKAIIWGSRGQDGYYLSQLLNILEIAIIPINREDLTISNFAEVRDLIQTHQADYLFNFAANSTTRHDAWMENHHTISTGTFNILEAVKEYSPQTIVFLSGSGLQFKNNGQPINEQAPFDATSVYSVSRIAMTYTARYYRKFGLRIYIGYFFNHDSPLRSIRHVNMKIITTAARIANGSKEKLEIGDMTVMKEFGFAGDIVKAIWTLVNQDEVHEAVIGTGKAFNIAHWLEICFRMYHLDWNDHVTSSGGFTPEYNILVSDPATIFSLGWRPETSIEELAKIMQP